MITSHESAPLRNRPRAVQILKIVNNAPKTKSLSFKDRLLATAKPGQFGMIWVPGVDELPMSLLPSNDDDVSITLKERGEGSRALLRMRVGDRIGIRGPYGNSFTHTYEREVLMVGGGTGTVPLLALLRSLVTRHTKCTFVLGARTSSELLFANEIEHLSTQTGGVFRITTDNGSTGTKGLTTDEAEKLLDQFQFDRIYTCGPERMMKKVIDLSVKANVPAEAGLERIFKCGSGICGSCCIGPYLVCKDGPVFSSEILKGLREFGKSTRDASGEPVAIGSVN